MTIQTILLNAPAGHGDPGCGPAAWAFGLASAIGATVTAVVLDADAHTGEPSEAARVPRREREAASHAAIETAERLAAAAVSIGVEAQVVTGRSFAYGLPEVLADHARLHDLVVTGVSRGGLLSERAMAEHLVFEAGRPVVVVPPAHRGPASFDRVAVAWDNSRVAARALGDAMPLLRRAREVSLLTVGGERPVDASLGEEAVVDALACRGVTVRYERMGTGGAAVGELLGRHALEAGADLLVMGAFGHSRLRQFMLGGATRSVLDGPRLPVLLSH